MNGPNKLEFYIELDWKGLPGTDILAYQADLQVTKKMNCCEYDLRPLGWYSHNYFYARVPYYNSDYDLFG